MATYAISFNLRYNDSYSERYNSLIEKIRSFPKVWEETTAFALVESEQELEAVERSLFVTKFNSSTDILLVIKVSYDDAIARGDVTGKSTLKTLLPGIEIK